MDGVAEFVRIQQHVLGYSIGILTNSATAKSRFAVAVGSGLNSRTPRNSSGSAPSVALEYGGLASSAALRRLARKRHVLSILQTRARRDKSRTEVPYSIRRLLGPFDRRQLLVVRQPLGGSCPREYPQHRTAVGRHRDRQS